MSGKPRGTLSVKAIKKQYSELSFKTGQYVLIVSSSMPEATISSAIISRSILKSDNFLHTTFVEPVVKTDEINSLKSAHPDSSLIVIGVDVVDKKRIKKGKGYPLFIGGVHESEQIQSLRLGNERTISAAAYILADEITKTGPEELQLAAAGTLLSNHSAKLKGAAREIVASAQKKGFIEETKGFRLFGVNFMPLNEVLAYSIRPYLPNLSGRPEICDKIYEEADIPYPKFKTPLSSLTSQEAKKMNEELLPKLDPSVIPQVLGKDFILSQEDKVSPVRLLSGIRAIAETAWTLAETGASTAIWIGDRARVLRGFLDSYMSLSKEVIAGVERMVATIQDSDAEGAERPLMISHVEAREEVMSDVGRVVLEANYIDTDRLMVISKESSIFVIWKSGAIALQDLFRSLMSQGIFPYATSSNSLRVNDTSEETRAKIKSTLESKR
ncbi:MAG: hypothetical protein ACXADC_01280 [Candidatus Thorarchaeota archaeon]|jgi:hypothetical protein